MRQSEVTVLEAMKPLAVTYVFVLVPVFMLSVLSCFLIPKTCVEHISTIFSNLSKIRYVRKHFERQLLSQARLLWDEVVVVT